MSIKYINILRKNFFLPLFSAVLFCCNNLNTKNTLYSEDTKDLKDSKYNLDGSKYELPLISQGAESLATLNEVLSALSNKKTQLEEDYQSINKELDTLKLKYTDDKRVLLTMFNKHQKNFKKWYNDGTSILQERKSDLLSQINTKKSKLKTIDHTEIFNKVQKLKSLLYDIRLAKKRKEYKNTLMTEKKKLEANLNILNKNEPSESWYITKLIWNSLGYLTRYQIYEEKKLGYETAIGKLKRNLDRLNTQLNRNAKKFNKQKYTEENIVENIKNCEKKLEKYNYSNKDLKERTNLEKEIIQLEESLGKIKNDLIKIEKLHNVSINKLETDYKNKKRVLDKAINEVDEHKKSLTDETKRLLNILTGEKKRLLNILTDEEEKLLNILTDEEEKLSNILKKKKEKKLKILPKKNKSGQEIKKSLSIKKNGDVIWKKLEPRL